MSAQSAHARQSHTGGSIGSPWLSKGPESTERSQERRAVAGAAAQTRGDELRRSPGLTDAGHEIGLGEPLDRRDGQREAHIERVIEGGVLHAVERDDGQMYERGGPVGFWLAGETAQDDDIRFGEVVGARQAGEPQLPIELLPVRVLAGDDERAPIGAAYIGGDPRGYLGIPGDEAQDRAVVLRRVLAARFVVARNAGPGRDGSEERQSDGGCRLNRLGDVRRPVGADERERSWIAGRGLCRPHRASAAMGDMLDAGGSKPFLDSCRQRLGQRGVHDHGASIPVGGAPA